jgi:hypothetical protein
LTCIQPRKILDRPRGDCTWRPLPAPLHRARSARARDRVNPRPNTIILNQSDDRLSSNVKRQSRETADGGQPSHFGTSIKSTRLPSLPFVRLLSLSQVAKWTEAHLQRATAQQFGCHRPPLALVLADKTKEGSLVSNCPSNVAWWALLFLLMMTRLTACSAPPSRAPYEGSGRTPTVPAGAEATPPRRWPNARGSQISQGQALCLPRSKLVFFFLSSFLRRKRKGDVVPEGPPTPMVRASLKPAHQKTHFETLYQRPCDTWCGWEPIFLLPGPVTHQSPWGKTALDGSHPPKCDANEKSLGFPRRLCDK